MTLSVIGGGGYASDLFLGAGLGNDGLVQITPAGRLDLSLSSEWKLALSGDISCGYFFSSKFASLEESAKIELRYRRADWEASLAIDGENGNYSISVPQDLVTSSNSSVSNASGAVLVRAFPSVLARIWNVEWRAAGVLAGRRLNGTASQDSVPEYEMAALGGAAFPLSPNGSLSLTYKFGHVKSDQDTTAGYSHAVFAKLFWRLSKLELQLQAQLELSKYDIGAQENLARIIVIGAYPLADSIDLQATYSLAANSYQNSENPSATRHLAFLAMRWWWEERL